jgi:U3 small nucleolar RNA-associated protein 18
MTPAAPEKEAENDEKAEESDDEEERIDEDEELEGETDDTAESSEDEMDRLKQVQIDGYGYGRKPAWEDTDDFALQVSLVGTNRTKKLRETEEEDVVSGVEYEQRLRQQFEKVHPVPSWATLPSLRESRKRRSKAVDGSDSEYSDEEEQHSDFEDDDDVHLLRSTHGILDKRRAAKKLPQKDLSVIRLKNANQMSYSQVCRLEYMDYLASIEQFYINCCITIMYILIPPLVNYLYCAIPSKLSSHDDCRFGQDLATIPGE